jgi:predicted nuclease of restriction endonuclease-like (RecB) superfamily
MSNANRRESSTGKAMNDKRKRQGREKDKVIIPAASSLLDMPQSYTELLADIKKQIHHSRLKAVLAANAALVVLYWQIGQSIRTRQSNEGWGAKVIDRLSFDLKEAFPDMQGFSPRNLKYMRAFAEAYPEPEFVQRLVAQIPWKSNLALIEKIKDPDLRLWYAQKTIENGWSHPILVHQIETALHQRIGQTNNNFVVSLPPEQSDMAVQIFKDPYIFDFLGTDITRRELDVEKALTAHVEKFLLELGQGFAFVGRQVLLEVGDSDFRLDLLFYHLKLRCYMVIELKAGKLEPGHVSQLGFYVNVVDDIMRTPDDKPTIGLLLVREKDHLVAEYCLQGYIQPLGIAEWQYELQKTLPPELTSSLPSIEEIEAELGGCDE